MFKNLGTGVDIERALTAACRETDDAYARYATYL